MSKTSGHDTAVKEESTDRLASDLDELKTNFGQLRQDVTRLLDNASGTAERRIIRKPLMSVAMAFGIGFVMARVFMPHR